MRGRLASLAAAAALLVFPAAAAAADAPWKDAGRVTDGLFDAQTELVLDGPAAAVKDAARARAAYAGDLRDDAARGRPGRRRARSPPACATPLAPRARATRPRSPPPAAASAPGSSAAPTR